MSRPARPIAIDARPQGPRGPLARERVLGRDVLDQLLDLADGLNTGEIAVHVRDGDEDAIAQAIADRPSRRYRLLLGPPRESAVILRSDRLYDPARLRKTLLRDGNPESAVVWRLDQPHGLQGADDELNRRRYYQPLGRFWALEPAKALATRLQKTRVHPNHLTTLAGLLVLVSSAGYAFGASHPIACALVSFALALALVLDTADGHLARLQGTASPFGRWLDAAFDELGDMTLHAGIAWAAYLRTGSVAWLLLGMAYGMGKYVFMIGNAIWADAPSPQTQQTDRPGPVPPPSGVRGLAHWLGHADIRWHAWIVLGAFGLLEWELALFSVYFPVRFLGGAVRKAGGHA